jgi:hypothetical protein
VQALIVDEGVAPLLPLGTVKGRSTKHGLFPMDAIRLVIHHTLIHCSHE